MFKQIKIVLVCLARVLFDSFIYINLIQCCLIRKRIFKNQLKRVNRITSQVCDNCEMIRDLR